MIFKPTEFSGATRDFLERFILLEEDLSFPNCKGAAHRADIITDFQMDFEDFVVHYQN